MFKHKLGSKVKDRVTGLTGIITNRSECLYGCNRYLIQPSANKEQKVPDSWWVDEDQNERKIMTDKTEPGAAVGCSAVLGDDGRTTPQTMDARAWAKDWLNTIGEHPGIPTDEGTMVTWFANAIMAGYDEAQRRHRANVDALKDRLMHALSRNDALTKVAEWLHAESPNSDYPTTNG